MKDYAQWLHFKWLLAEPDCFNWFDDEGNMHDIDELLP
jgi:hypothetical protein